jgi:hypothetical protein
VAYLTRAAPRRRPPAMETDAGAGDGASGKKRRPPSPSLGRYRRPPCVLPPASPSSPGGGAPRRSHTRPDRTLAPVRGPTTGRRRPPPWPAGISTLDPGRGARSGAEELDPGRRSSIRRSCAVRDAVGYG